MKNSLSVFAFFIIIQSSIAQSVIIEEDIAADTIPATKGPNLNQYSHLYVGFGLIVGPIEGSGVNLLHQNSTNFQAGYRFKRRISRINDVGFDLYYGVTSFRLRQETGKTFPTPGLYEREKINFSQVGLNLYHRFNFGRRGNIIRNFIDIGAWGQYEFMTKHVSFQRHTAPNNQFARKTRVASRDLDYANTLNYGVQARIGIRRYSIYGLYRISDIIRDTYKGDPFNFPELPRLIVGLQIGLHG
ncbi:MAG: hypothetical protein H0X62_15820 [Bacteroidetes bacterium]|nr:hypothetical protein [Bacteroidota bacterium]